MGTTSQFLEKHFNADYPQERSVGRPAPKFGEHNLEELQDWLGSTAAEVDELIAQGVLLDRPPG